MDKHGEKSLVKEIAIVFFIGWTFIASMISYIAGCKDQSKRAQKEAVLKGAAEYAIDESGNPVFQWKENK